MEHPALEGRSVLHANHHAGEQAFKHPGWRKVIGRADFFEVNGGGGGRLGAVHHIAAAQPLRVAENVLPDPGHRHIGQHLFSVGQMVKVCTGTGAVEQGVVRMHHTFGVARGAGGEKHGCGVIGLHLRHRVFKESGVGLGVGLARRLQRVHGLQAVLGVIAQAAWVVVVDMGELGRVLAHFEELVDLLLVLGKRKANLGVVDGEHTLRRDSILVQRHRNGA